jgi:hypothetical protein
MLSNGNVFKYSILFVLGRAAKNLKENVKVMDVIEILDKAIA